MALNGLTSRDPPLEQAPGGGACGYGHDPSPRLAGERGPAAARHRDRGAQRRLGDDLGRRRREPLPDRRRQRRNGGDLRHRSLSGRLHGGESAADRRLPRHLDPRLRDGTAHSPTRHARRRSNSTAATAPRPATTAAKTKSSSAATTPRHRKGRAANSFSPTSTGTMSPATAKVPSRSRQRSTGDRPAGRATSTSARARGLGRSSPATRVCTTSATPARPSPRASPTCAFPKAACPGAGCAPSSPTPAPSKRSAKTPSTPGWVAAAFKLRGRVPPRHGGATVRAFRTPLDGTVSLRPAGRPRYDLSLLNPAGRVLRTSRHGLSFGHRLNYTVCGQSRLRVAIRSSRRSGGAFKLQIQRP